MWDKFKDWQDKYQTENNWFFIGLFTSQAIQSISKGDWSWASIEIFLIILNILVWKNDRK